MNIRLTEFPNEHDWMEVKRRALVTVGLKAKTPPSLEWKKKITEARHSPIRRLRFSFDMEGIPSWVSVHFVRHVHAQPYVRTQRNDRQSNYDRAKAPQDSPVDMIFDVNGEELLVILNKRLCRQASPETRRIAEIMKDLVIEKCPELEEFLVPMCEYHGGICHEIYPCGRCEK